MALITRRYQFVGPTSPDLVKYIGPTSAQVLSFPGAILDISVENTVSDFAVAANEFMESLGFVFAPGAVPAGSSAMILSFGVFDILLATGTVFLPPWYDVDGIADTAAINLVVPYAGTLSKLYVYHNDPSGGANTITYAIMVNGVATAMTVTLAANVAGPGTDLVNTAAVVAGDRISLRAVKPLVLLSGRLKVVATMSLTG